MPIAEDLLLTLASTIDAIARGYMCLCQGGITVSSQGLVTLCPEPCMSRSAKELALRRALAARASALTPIEGVEPYLTREECKDKVGARQRAWAKSWGHRRL